MVFLRKLYYNDFVNRLNRNLKIRQKTYLAFAFVIGLLVLIGLENFIVNQTIKKREAEILFLENLSDVNKSMLFCIAVQTSSVFGIRSSASGILERNREILSCAKESKFAKEIYNVTYLKLENINEELYSSLNSLLQNIKDNDDDRFAIVLAELEETGLLIEKEITILIKQQDRIYSNIHIINLGTMLLTILITLLISSYVAYRITSPIEKINENIQVLTSGNYGLKAKFDVLDNDEIGDVAHGIDSIGKMMRETILFTEEMGKNNFEAYLKLEKEGALASALIKMRDNLKDVTVLNEVRKAEEEKSNWVIHGLARFSEILRMRFEDIDELYFNIIQNLVSYIDANQGGLFLATEHDGSKWLELKAMYAYNRKKYKEKQIEFGEGVIGQVALEKQTVYITEIPDSYMEITSGLGSSSPKSLILVPLKLDDSVFGVIEIASFKVLEEFHVEFLEKAAESIATSVSAMQTNIHTSELLEKTRQQAEEMGAQEEEMRQNMEELQATQEESDRRSKEIESLLAEAMHKEGATKKMLDEANEREMLFQEKLADALDRIEDLEIQLKK